MNASVLDQMRNETEILNTIKRQNLEYLGHIIRNDKYYLLQVIIQRKNGGKRAPGRKKISWLKKTHANGCLRSWRTDVVSKRERDSKWCSSTHNRAFR